MFYLQYDTVYQCLFNLSNLQRNIPTRMGCQSISGLPAGPHLYIWVEIGMHCESKVSYYISQLVRALLLVSLDGRTLLYGPLNSKI